MCGSAPMFTLLPFATAVSISLEVFVQMRNLDPTNIINHIESPKSSLIPTNNKVKKVLTGSLVGTEQRVCGGGPLEFSHLAS